MNEFSTYEYVVTKKREGTYRTARICLFALYIVYVIVFFAICVLAQLLVPAIGLIPVTLWMLVFFTWRYVNVDYEYSITSGVLTFSKIYGNRSKKMVTEIKLKSAATIAPLHEKIHRSKLDAYYPAKTYSALSSPNAPDAYFMIYEDEDKVRCAFFFEATGQAQKIFRFYNAPATVLTKVTF